MDKSPDAFRTISEVAELLETPAHVLRFWESRFPQIKPVKRAGGRRYYRPADLALLTGIRRLLHDEGLTIRGVQKILREQGVRHVSGLAEEEEAGFSSDETIGAQVEDTVISSNPIPLFPHLAEPEQTAPTEPSADLTDGIERISAAPVVDEADGPFDPPEIATSPNEESVIYAAGTTPAQEAATAKEAASDPEDAADSDAALANVTPPTAPETAKAEPLAPAFPFDGPFDSQADAASESGEPESAPDQDNVEPEQADMLDQPAPEHPAQGLQTDDVAAEDTPVSVPAQPDETVSLTADVEGDVVDTVAVADPRPTPMPPEMDITGHWLPADLRALRKGALVGKTDQAAALFSRLEALRNRVGDRGRVPRR